MKHSISMLFVSLMMAYVLAASAQQLPASSWTNPYFFYHYNAPLAMAPQKPSPYQMTGNQNVFSSLDDHSLENTLGSHVVMLSTCLRELKTTRADLVQTTHRLDQTHTDIQSVKNELKGTVQLLADVKTTVETMKKEMKGNDAATNIGRMPKSCDDLQTIGHRKSGFFTVMGTKTVDNVYCDFAKPTNDSGFQKMIGSVNVKSSPVYFHAQKSKSHTAGNTIVPFEILRLNVGNAMSTSGIFVAPKSGKYFFTYSGISEGGSHARVDLQVKTDTADWTRVGQAFGNSGHQTFSLQATLDLAKGNQIRLLLVDGQIHENGMHSHYTSFVGELMDEEIVQ